MEIPQTRPRNPGRWTCVEQNHAHSRGELKANPKPISQMLVLLHAVVWVSTADTIQKDYLII